MTPTRVLILLVVLIAALFAISLALADRSSGQPVEPTNSWFNRLTRPKKFDLHEVVPTSGWEIGRWTIPNGVRDARLEIDPSKTRQAIRRVKLTLAGASEFHIEFRPRPDPDRPDRFADPEAMPLKITGFKPGPRGIELTVLKHGGSLLVTRASGAGPAIFQFE